MLFFPGLQQLEEQTLQQGMRSLPELTCVNLKCENECVCSFHYESSDSAYTL